MVFKLPRLKKTAEDTPATGPEPAAMAAEEMPLPSGITVNELEKVLGGLYTVPSLRDY